MVIGFDRNSKQKGIKLYIVKYSSGRYDDYFERELFYVETEQEAKDYVENLNQLKYKLEDRAKQFCIKYKLVNDSGDPDYLTLRTLIEKYASKFKIYIHDGIGFSFIEVHSYAEFIDRNSKQKELK